METTPTFSPLETWLFILTIAAFLFAGIKWLDRLSSDHVSKHVQRAIDFDRALNLERRPDWDDLLNHGCPDCFEEVRIHWDVVIEDEGQTIAQVSFPKCLGCGREW